MISRLVNILRAKDRLVVDLCKKVMAMNYWNRTVAEFMVRQADHDL